MHILFHMYLLNKLILYRKISAFSSFSKKANLLSNDLRVDFILLFVFLFWLDNATSFHLNLEHYRTVSKSYDLVSFRKILCPWSEKNGCDSSFLIHIAYQQGYYAANLILSLELSLWWCSCKLDVLTHLRQSICILEMLSFWSKGKELKCNKKLFSKPH